VLGGPGDLEENLVAMYQSANNRMKTLEMKVKKAVEDGQKVNYIVTPKYGAKPYPDEIHIYAEGDNGFKLDEIIRNEP